jgi:mono/diheme cytochrome c family protein
MKFRLAIFVSVFVWGVGVSHSSLRAEQAPAAAAKTVWDGVFTAAQAKRGEATFAKECSSCHGNDLAGDGFAPALAGSDFLSNWNELSVGDLFDRIRISMPPNGPSGVSATDKADIVAHIMNSNKWPAGNTELEAKTEVLKQIKIEMKK